MNRLATFLFLFAFAHQLSASAAPKETPETSVKKETLIMGRPRSEVGDFGVEQPNSSRETWLDGPEFTFSGLTGGAASGGVGEKFVIRRERSRGQGYWESPDEEYQWGLKLERIGALKYAKQHFRHAIDNNPSQALKADLDKALKRLELVPNEDSNGTKKQPLQIESSRP